MIESINIKNFKCYENHTINFGKLAIVVGKNNAGKSTFVEVLRIVSTVLARNITASSLRNAPSEFNLTKIQKGILVSLKNIEITSKNLFYKYGKPPALITVFFTQGNKIEIHLADTDKCFCEFFDSDGRRMSNHKTISSIGITNIMILPQIVPLQEKERKLDVNYVLSHLSSTRSSLHFRNQIHYLQSKYFENFKNNVSKNWPGIDVDNYEVINDDEEGREYINLFVRENDFIAEVGWMGDGFQMWLQTMWFLTRCMPDDTVILDEPDNFMHADLQRKLIRTIRNKYNQLIIATHSTEIIAEVEQEAILLIDRTQKKSTYLTKNKNINKLLNNTIGTIHNIDLSRLWASNKILLVEGGDIGILNGVYSTLFVNSPESLRTIPHMSIDGWNGWDYAIGSNMLKQNAINNEIVTYCILDRDYKTDEIIVKRKIEAKNKGISLHIWSMKEIENYLIVPTAIRRCLVKNNKESAPTVETIRDLLNSIYEKIYSKVEECFTTEFSQSEKGLTAGKASSKAKEFLKNYNDNPIRFVPGKEVLSMLNQMLREQYKVSFSSVSISRELKKEEINTELVSVLTSIKNNLKFE